MHLFKRRWVKESDAFMVVWVPVEYATVLRDVFVGSLCAIGVFLFCYRGYDWIETWTGRVGSFFALGVALCPLDANSDPLFQTTFVGYAHTLFGGGFFLTLAFYSLYHFPVEPDGQRANVLSRIDYERNLVYRLSGVVGNHMTTIFPRGNRTAGG